MTTRLLEIDDCKQCPHRQYWPKPEVLPDFCGLSEIVIETTSGIPEWCQLPKKEESKMQEPMICKDCGTENEGEHLEFDIDVCGGDLTWCPTCGGFNCVEINAEGGLKCQK